mmetsp:Transcript_20367/g.56750  ORF Transcript_20367/g.56750 Transcript_20367/m.56750 type:complete len:262 (-) Transcript_20367:824-1609(-)
MSLLTLCFSIYSPMSMRTIIFSSSNSSAARALASSVLPTPVGPRNRKDAPRLRAAKPARPRSTASATALTASFWPTTRLCSSLDRCSSFSRSVCCKRTTGMPVHLDTTVAISSGPTASVSMALVWGAASRSILSRLSTSGRAPYLRSAIRARSPRCSARPMFTSICSRLACSPLISSRRARSLLYCTTRGARCSSRAASSFLTCSKRPILIWSFSFFRAACSTCSLVRIRSIPSMTSGLESSSTRTLEHASSIRSMALSGK